MSTETFTLAELHAHCTQHNYPVEAERLEHYMELKAEENRQPVEIPGPSKQWQEALAAQRAAA